MKFNEVSKFCGSACMMVVIVSGLFKSYSAPPSIAPGDTVLITADNPRINYYGRFDFTTPAKPRFNWSGAIIEAAFPGPIIGMRMVHANAYYDIEIDGVLDTTISTGTNRIFFFRSDLSAQLHTVRVILRNEDHWNAATFLGFYIAAGKELGPAPPKPARKIEFIGDSYTAGYGNETPCINANLQKYTNANRAFAANVTRAFHAQSIILGWSGAGMVRNYGENGKRSASPFPAHYDKTLGEADNTVKWDYSTWKPELVVICLGTNDYSTNPYPDDSMYVGDYHKFISRVLGNYPNAAILCVSTGNAVFERNVKRVVNEETAMLNHPRVFFAPYPQGLSYSGCDGHPSVDDNKKISAALVDTIMKKLGWDTTALSASLVPSLSMQPAATGHLSSAVVKNRLYVSFAGSIRSGMSICLTNPRGALLDCRKIDPDCSCVFNIDRYGPGIYLAGNNSLGWARIVVQR